MSPDPNSNGKVPAGAAPAGSSQPAHAVPPPRALPGGGEIRRHVLVAVVLNKPGVLNRVSSLMRARNFNIDSLAVGPTDHPDVSRMTLVVDVEELPLEQVTKQLNKLVEVLKVVDAKDAQKLFDIGEDIDKACENCHRQYWYPNEKIPDFPSAVSTPPPASK